ncbi:hypothetical protein, partial [Klebsiella quasipneumoniae]|uniref:hypothetical protein n=1 Tax=Klebsiella quasipneumoniae TaxID=1463165 RepID=UPI0019402610
MSEKKFISELFLENNQFILVGLTGRTGSGCTTTANILESKNVSFPDLIREGANKQVISSQADSLIKISRIWAD